MFFYSGRYMDSCISNMLQLLSRAIHDHEMCRWLSRSGDQWNEVMCFP